MLNKSFVEKIKQSLNSKYFTASDFELSLPESGDALLTINFKYANYELRFVETTERDEYTETNALYGFNNIRRSERFTRHYAIYNPGEYKSKDKIATSFSELENVITKWSEFIANDLVVNVNDESVFDEIRNELGPIFTVDNVENECESASPEEQVEVAQKLDKLYERLEELNEKVKLAEEEMDKIKEEIDTLKMSASNMPKGVWAKIAKNRLVEIAVKFFKTPEGRELIVHTIKQALPN